MTNDTIHPLAKTNEKIETIHDQLPTLDDVLYRQSQPPVCLFNYYIVLRDRLQLEVLLDFWLDVAQADILYKRYLKHLRKKSGTTLKKPSIASSFFTEPGSILTQMLLQPKRPPPTQPDLIEAIERIYLRYVVPSAQKELHLPPDLTEPIHQFFRSEGPKDNPAIFGQAHRHVRHLLDSTFPLFLAFKVYMNLTWPQQLARLGFGLLSLLFGFSLEFSLIFLDIHPWQKRLWGLIPIGLGVFCVVTSISGIDPIWVLLFNLSETVPFQFNHIIQLKVKKILRKRSVFVSLIIFLVTLLLMIFFCAVAGKRL